MDRYLPSVISVTASETDHPTSRIIHLISPGTPSKGDFLLALNQMADGRVSQDKLDSLYDEYVLQIKRMQIEHAVIVRCLVKSHGLRRIYVESTSPRDFLLSQSEAEFDSRGDDFGSEGNTRVGLAQVVVDGGTHWIDALISDFPGEFQHWKAAEVRHPRVTSSKSIFKQSNSFAKLVQVRSGQMLDAEAQATLTDGACCLIVGDANDFTESVKRIADGKCEYVRIETRCWRNRSHPVEE